MALVTTQSHDFSVSPAASVDFAIPSGHTMGFFVGQNLTISANAFWYTGDDSQFYDTLGDYHYCASPSSIARQDAKGLRVRNRTGDGTGQYIVGHIFGLNILSPVFTHAYQTNVSIGMKKVVTPINKLRFADGNGSTISTGKITLTTYERAATVSTIDLTDFGSAIANFDSGIIDKGLFTVSSPDANVTQSSNIGFRFGVDGVYDVGGYTATFIGNNFYDETKNVNFLGSVGAAGFVPHAAIFMGLPYANTRSAMFNHGYLASSSSIATENSWGWRSIETAHNSIRVQSFNSPFDAGTLYLTQYDV